jgi:hypothetical protein
MENNLENVNQTSWQEIKQMRGDLKTWVNYRYDFAHRRQKDKLIGRYKKIRILAAGSAR